MADTPNTEHEHKDTGEQIDALRKGLLDKLTVKDATGEDVQEVERREKELGFMVDGVTEYLKTHESDEVKSLREKVEAMEAEPAADRVGGQSKDLADSAVRAKDLPMYGTKDDGDRDPDANIFADYVAAGLKNDYEAATRISDYTKAIQSPAREKAWATGDLEDADLVLPDIQAALPFLQAQAKVVGLCRELRTTTTSVEFPVYTSSLDVAFVDDQALATKPESDPTFDLISARIYTIAGTTQVPNSTLEDYATARGWISSELGKATGILEDLTVLQGSGVGQPTGFLKHSLVTGRAATDVNADGKIKGHDAIDAIFRAIQDVRTAGFTEPTNIVLNPAVWTDIVLSFEANIGYLYGPPQTEGGPDSGPVVGEPAPRLLGLPVTQDAYVTKTYGGTSSESPILVGDFSDAVVLRRSPFRIDVDTSLGFRVNTTWFRGEERMGFIIVRPASFKVVTNVVPTA